ncbi:MAG: DNA repair protein RadC [Bacteroidales bacterium]|jgi:DNA repair protein RadC|nr:DNA repair protein RadC [Bacteroidales bacterium]
MRIKDLCPDERPREKLRLRGAKALSNAELLAILLGSGTGGKSVLEVAQELMKTAGGRLNLLGAMPLERLITQKGVGEVRAITLAAALELGRRTFEESAIADKRSLTSPEMVFQLMLPTLKNLDHEECWALFLNKANFLISKEMITSGSLESTLVDTARILKRAIEKQSSYVILVHNHPSGSPLPGPADIHQTACVKKALSSVGISLMDHVVVAEDSFFSFSEERTGHL